MTDKQEILRNLFDRGEFEQVDLLMKTEEYLNDSSLCNQIIASGIAEDNADAIELGMYVLWSQIKRTRVPVDYDL